jgi:hypothetical protein
MALQDIHCFTKLLSILGNTKKNRSKDRHQLAAFFFQKAAIAALKDVFEPTGTAIQGCYFHFTQAVWRKIRSVRYLANFQ